MKKGYLVWLLVFAMIISGCTQNQAQNQESEIGEMKNIARYGKIENLELKKMCIDAGYGWMLMRPTDGGKIMKDSEDCWGCMVEGIEHVCSTEKFMDMMKK